MQRILSRRLSAVLLLLVAVAVLTGCVRRRLTVRSNPPGAAVYVDNQLIGVTPVSDNFTYYGTRSITLVKDGFETLTVKQNFDAPWYQVPPLDFVSENITPREERDERVLDFTLQPQMIVPPEALLQNAENLRQNAQQGFVAPLPGIPAQTLPPGAPLPMSAAPTRGPWR